MNFGFVTGDEGIPYSYLYATAYPQPEGLTEQTPDQWSRVAHGGF
jgi:hypothetical protein